MGRRGISSSISKAIRPRRPSRAKSLPWEKKGLSRAEKVIAFCEFLPITSGIHAGRRLVLRDWQKEIINGLYGVDGEGRRRVRTALVTLPRKNGKTCLASALALAHLIGPESERRGGVFSAASDREQASLLFREMEAVILSVPEFACRCKIQQFRKLIEDTVTGSVYTALTADARKAHGLSVSFCVCDELAQWRDRELWDNITTGTGARKEPLVVAISTQSADPNHIMSELVDYALKIEDGNLPHDPAFFGCVYCAPDGCDPWAEAEWFKCNPALDDFRSLEEMQIFAEQARKIPAKESTFRALYLNQRVDSEAKWIGTVDFEACVGVLPDLDGRECYAGLDLSSTQDLSALSLCFLPTNGEPFYTKHFAWCPADAIRARSKRDRVPYDLWHRLGFIEATPGAVVDYSYILKRLDSIKKQFNLKAVLFDRWGSSQITKDIEAMGLTILEHGQGFASMSAPSKELEKLILQRKIVFPDNPCLKWNFANVICEVDAAANYKPSKKKSKERIDMVVSTIMSLDGALRNTKKEIAPNITWI